MFKPDRTHMQAAIDEAMRYLGKEGGGPFGACIVKNGQVLVSACNTVLADTDPTCHAEVNAIRKAAKKLGTFDLSGCTIYSTTEPCPMCFSAIHWARIDAIVSGTAIKDVQDLGFNELEISNQTMKSQGKSPVFLVPNFMRNECLDLLQAWSETTSGTTY